MGKKVYIGLGSNMGNREAYLERAGQEIRLLPGTEIINSSSLYTSSPWGKMDQDDYINQVIEIETGLSPIDLLHSLQDIEIKMGRQRVEKWGPRVIDLDILLYGQSIIKMPELIVPHPYVRERLFVLIPLAELNTDLVFPEDGMNIGEVLNRLLEREGKQEIWKA